VQADVSLPRFAFNAGTLTGAGVLTLEESFAWTGGTISGAGRTIIASNAVATVSGGANKGLDSDRVLENRGTVDWSGGNLDFNSFSGGGSGRIENAVGALWISSGSGDRSVFRTGHSDLNSAPLARFDNAGTFRLGTNGGRMFLDVALECHGFLEVVSGELVLRSVTHTFDPGVGFGGAGTLRIQSPIVVGAPLNFSTLNVVFEGGATLTGAFNLANGPGGTITVSKTMTFPGSMTIAGVLTIGDASFTATINSTLTLEATGVLNNPGTVRVAQFVNNGGTINGNPPLLLVPGPSPLRIERILLADSAAGGGGAGEVRPAGSGQVVVLKWRATPGERFGIESTTDLRTWTDLAAVVSETGPGSFEAALPAEGVALRFYRLRRLLLGSD
jgi:hypothetical protein